MKVSARNQIPGRIFKINEGAVNAIVEIKVSEDIIISSTISMESIKELNLKVGSRAYAVIKSTSVMIGIE
ncbi:molybdenum-pterin binding domain [Gottschalkia purinilytica]|uniref:Molybdenum-pterin binding domain n=1 Tax=Gottschalkia purinilytica TaxID=1503 RepID=A0A0L0W7V1_GOTPU|nr:TOBE domain-containing protein [Gottschalkia purinilytica]KNF07653.1 molybdenum-pterin binding domain [Gottschalkia purinilytica]